MKLFFFPFRIFPLQNFFFPSLLILIFIINLEFHHFSLQILYQYLLFLSQINDSYSSIFIFHFQVYVLGNFFLHQTIIYFIIKSTLLNSYTFPTWNPVEFLIFLDQMVSFPKSIFQINAFPFKNQNTLFWFELYL